MDEINAKSTKEKNSATDALLWLKRFVEISLRTYPQAFLFVEECYFSRGFFMNLVKAIKQWKMQ